MQATYPELARTCAVVLLSAAALSVVGNRVWAQPLTNVGWLAPQAIETRKRNAPDLDRIVRSITTVAHHSDGTTSISIGSGFVIGSHLFTVYHNLEVAGVGDASRTITYLDDVALQPTVADRESDLAVFDLPRELCARHCNNMALTPSPLLKPTQRIRWLRKVPGDRRWRSARILNYAFIGEQRSRLNREDVHACDRNVIVELDTPFISGSSGSPVVDSDTGQIVGIVQGSLERGSESSGFFKPIECAMRMVDPPHTKSAANL